MKSNEERRSKLSQICTMKTAYHQKYKTQTKKEERQTDKQTSKLKSFRKISQRIIQFTPNVNKQRQRS